MSLAPPTPQDRGWGGSSSFQQLLVSGLWYGDIVSRLKSAETSSHLKTQPAVPPSTILNWPPRLSNTMSSRPLLMSVSTLYMTFMTTLAPLGGNKKAPRQRPKPPLPSCECSHTTSATIAMFPSMIFFRGSSIAWLTIPPACGTLMMLNSSHTSILLIPNRSLGHCTTPGQKFFLS